MGKRLLIPGSFRSGYLDDTTTSLCFLALMNYYGLLVATTFDHGRLSTELASQLCGTSDSDLRMFASRRTDVWF
jgi:hypothetical protein